MLRDVGVLFHRERVDDAESRDGVHDGRAVVEREAFLRLELDGLHSDLYERLGCRHNLALVDDVAGPMSEIATCESGQRSPLAPTEPCVGTTG